MYPLAIKLSVFRHDYLVHIDNLVSGMDLPFEWDQAEAFVRQPDGSLFSWCERFHCYRHIIYGVVSCSIMYKCLRRFSWFDSICIPEW